MKRRVIWLLAVLVPMIFILAHHEMRKVLLSDLHKFRQGNPYAFRSLPRTPEEERILEALKVNDIRQRAELLEKAYRETGQLWVGMLALLTWSGALSVGFDRKDAEVALKLANELCAKDPENALPLLLKSRLLFALQSNKEAIDTLLQASRRSRFETYAGEFVKLLNHEALPADERLINVSAALPWTVGFSLGPFHRYVTDSITRLMNEGKPKAALQLVEGVLDLGKLMREQSFWVMDALIGMALQGVAIERISPLSAKELSTLKALPSEEKWREALRIRLKKFRSFATRHGRPDLVEKVERERAISEQLRQKIRSEFVDKFVLGNLTSLEFERLFNMRMAGQALLATIGLLFAASVFVFIATGGIFLQRRIAIDGTIKAERGTEKLTEMRLFVTATATAIVPLGFAVSAILGKIQTQIFGNSPIAIMTPAFVKVTVALTLLWLTFLCILPILKRTRWWRHGWSLLAILSLLVAAVLTVWAFIPEKGELAISLEYESTVQDPTVQSLLEEIFGKPQPPNIFQTFLIKFPAELVLTALGLALLFFSIASLKGQPEELAERRKAVTTFYRSALLLMVICWWSYAVVSIASLPVRTKLSANLNAIAERGEWKVVRERLFGGP